MEISQKSKEIIDSCRFCWMCRHICPIGNATGQERNTARARALALSLVERNAEPLSAVKDNVYECALCGACTKECVTGWDPVKFTREVRLELALNGETPDYINKLILNVEKYKNIYGKKNVDKELLNEIRDLPKKAKIVLFLGRDAIYKSPKNAVNAIKLLKKAKVDFTVMENEPDSGADMNFLVGDAEETRLVAQKTAEALSFETVIVYDPKDAKIFLREYKEWNVNMSARVVPFTSLICDLILNNKLKINKSDITFTLQDSHFLARDLEETECARNILEKCGNIKEMLLNKKDTILAGSLIMNEYMPDVMKIVAKNRWQNVLNVEASVLVTESPAEYELLKLVKPKNAELLTIEEVVLKCL